MKKLLFLFISLLLVNASMKAQTISILEARGMNDDDTVMVSGVTSNGSEFGIIRYFTACLGIF